MEGDSGQLADKAAERRTEEQPDLAPNGWPTVVGTEPAGPTVLSGCVHEQRADEHIA
jgi:hypothetical protein